MTVAALQQKQTWASGRNSEPFQFLDPDFSTECKILTFWWCFQCILALDWLKVRHIFTSDAENVQHVSLVTMITSTKFEVDMTIHCRIISFLLLIFHVTLWPWPLCSHIPSHVINLFTTSQVWRSQVYPFLSYESWRLPWFTIYSAFEATAQAPDHVVWA